MAMFSDGSVLAGVDRAAQPVAGGLGERGGEGGVVDVALDRVGAHADQQVAVGHRSGESSAISMAWAGPVGLSKSRIMRQLMSRSWRASRTPALDALPHGLDGHAEADHEAGREEHLAVAHAGGGAVLERLVRDAAEVVGGAQAGADHVVDREELVEAGELVQLGRVVDGQVDVVLGARSAIVERPRRALHVAVQLDLRQAAEVLGRWRRSSVHLAHGPAEIVP